MKRRILSILMVVFMLTSMLPAAVFVHAADGDPRTVTITVVVGSGRNQERVPDAKVTINGDEYTANDEGEIAVTLVEGSRYTAEASAIIDGKPYAGNVSFEVNRRNNNHTITITDQTPYTATVSVTFDSTPVSGAVVTVDGQTLTTNASGQVTVELPNGSYDVEASYTTGGKTYNKETTLRVNGEGSSAEIAFYEESDDWAVNRYNSVSTFDHVDVRVNGSLTVGTTGSTETKSVKISNVELIVKSGSTTLVDTTFNNNQTYEWRVTGLRVPKDAVVSIVCDLTYDGVTKADQSFSFSGKDAFVQAIRNCDNRQGLDFIISAEDIKEAIFHDVTYTWTGLPEGLETLPTGESGVVPGAYHTINTHFVEGTYRIDETTGKIYVFKGWKEYSTDNGASKNAITGSTLAINADTIIYGEWYSVELETVPSHIVITKTLTGNDGNVPSGMHFQIVGPEGNVTVVYYSSFTNGSYSLPVYESGTYAITEHDPEIAGYTHTDTTVSENGGATIEASSVTIDVTVDYVNPYDPNATATDERSSEVVGTVAFTNKYEKKVSDKEIHNYPSMTILKEDSASGAALEGAVFTLSDGTNIYTSTETNLSGVTSFSNIKPGTYTLTETVAPAGYSGGASYKVTVAVSGDPTETLVNGEYVKTYNYTITVTGSDGKATNDWFGDSGRLHVKNTLLNYSLTVHKAFGTDSAFDVATIGQTLAEIEITVTGPNNYSETFTLHANNNFTHTLTLTTAGKYVVTENTSKAVVRGYDLSVSNISTSVSVSDNNRSPSVTITNTYTQRTAESHKHPSLTVVKVDAADSNKKLSGAVFSLYDDEYTLIGHYTTDSDGDVSIPELHGGVYYLKEITAPAGYTVSNTTWKITVGFKETVTGDTPNADGYYTITHYYEITSVEASGTANDSVYSGGTLTVENSKQQGTITVTKSVEAYLDNAKVTGSEWIPSESYTFNVTIGGDTKKITLANGESWTSDPVEYGTTYSVTEVVPADAAWEYIPAENSSGTVAGASTTVAMKNVYHYLTTSVQLRKVDTSDTTKPVPGAVYAIYSDAECEDQIATATTGSDGSFNFPITSFDGDTYYFKEIDPPDGYHIDSTVYKVETSAEVDELYGVPVKQIEATVSGVSTDSTGHHVVSDAPILPIEIKVTKTWDDNANASRPASVEVQLYRDGTAYGDPATLSASNNWTYTWSGAEYTDEYTWTIDEISTPAGYMTPIIKKTVDDVTHDVTVDIVNTMTASPITISVTKEWINNSEYDRSNPSKVEVTLYRDGVAYDTVELNRKNNWSYEWSGAEFTNAYVWIVDEVNVPSMYNKTVIKNGYDFTIINERILDTVDISVEKVWVNNGAVNPESIEVTLYRNGSPYEKVTLSEANGWKYTWEDLDEDDSWYVDEDNVPENYKKNVRLQFGTDYVITNTFILEGFDLTVNKVWVGDHVLHPETVEVTLYRDGEAYETVTLDAATGWTYTWTGLTNANEWTVDEAAVPANYIKSITVDGDIYTITNTTTVPTPEFTDITVEKVWAGEGEHPTSVNVVLYRDGEVYETVTLTEENGWSYTWANLNTANEWTVDEVNVPEGYVKSVTQNGYNYVITNTEKIDTPTPEEYTITVEKVWAGDVEHPASAEVVLYRDGEAYDTVTLSEENGWKYSWTVTDEYEWTVDEINVPDGYTKIVDVEGNAYIITNCHNDIPKTGDENGAAWWLLISVISMIGFAWCAIELRRTKVK